MSLSLIWALVAGPFAVPTGHGIEPSDDVWVYSFASDQTTDRYLRAWGNDSGSVSEVAEGSLTFSYSCLRFDLPDGLDPEKLTAARLVLTHVGDPGFDEETSRQNPIEARALSATFKESDWDVSMAPKVHPLIGAQAVFGTGWSRPSQDETPFKVVVDLMQGPGDFKAALAVGMRSNRSLALALTTKMNPQGAGESNIYKFFSRHNEAGLRPVLELVAD
ncbi:MAG: hypothetical protein KF884_05880 [Fimbriimonadaceae bacterium]|nr:hypothetical protein [Fimbriimonadaceae bacterium]QYK59615.1 MAG: hypothetical protein KF884_05880 [Fimbriimonadaceae bacterium]